MSKKVIISGGGTGGHIFPAISIANALVAIDKEIQLLFVGAKDRMEMEKVPAAGYSIKGLPVAGFQRRFTFKNVTFFFKLVNSMIMARSILKRFKPDVVVGVGGYASGPMLKVAAQNNIPTLIQEQNSYAGVTNRLLAKKSKRICVAYEGMDKYFPAEKIIFTGNPVRQDIIINDEKRSEGLKYFSLDGTKKTVLLLGGSLGAKTLNETIAGNIGLLASANYQFIWQCGKAYKTAAQEVMKNSMPENVKLFDFISRMDLAYAAADIIISRAGAGSISELCLVGKPCILVPSPNVAEDHQTKNALALVNKNAALMVLDIEARTMLINTVNKLISDEALCTLLSVEISKLAIKDSAHRIAQEIMLLIENNKK